MDDSSICSRVRVSSSASGLCAPRADARTLRRTAHQHVRHLHVACSGTEGCWHAAFRTSLRRAPHAVRRPAAALIRRSPYSHRYASRRRRRLWERGRVRRQHRARRGHGMGEAIAVRGHTAGAQPHHAHSVRRHHHQSPAPEAPRAAPPRRCRQDDPVARRLPRASFICPQGSRVVANLPIQRLFQFAPIRGVEE